ncbi:hypothetical protein EDB81DRAFT_913235 [Dactylonectria macrodidyma]|uniref:Glutathione S-transferase UstS-like C-terminal domain-containing protein n=1 Tax=Dactylonectria macrodidyma TaxID=307937 RepID=A0A9P9IL16_9HYPO|nr:hypothetical protein EDB81DRAFT_913235 [Dactylonectria macrodidyma]
MLDPNGPNAKPEYDFLMLPIIEDPATESLVGDSFDIAVYLQKTYPNSGAGDLFPPQTLNYDFMLSLGCLYRYRSVLRVHFSIGEAPEKVKQSFRNMLGGLGELFLRDTSGPIILGARVSCADFIVAAWLRMMRASLPDSEWDEVASWHEGLFGRLHDALEVYAETK